MNPLLVRSLDQSMSHYQFLSTDAVRRRITQPTVPPTFLHFTLIMEAYLGFKVMEMHDGRGSRNAHIRVVLFSRFSNLGQIQTFAPFSTKVLFQVALTMQTHPIILPSILH